MSEKRKQIYPPYPKSKPVREYVLNGWAVVDSEGNLNSGHQLFPVKQEAIKWAEGCGNTWYYLQGLGITLRRVRLTVKSPSRQ